MTVHYKGLVIDRASAVGNGGLHASDGLTIHYDGLTITDSGITITDGGLEASVLDVNGGLQPEDSLAVRDGAVIAGNLYIHDGSLEVTGDSYINDGVNITAAPSNTGGLSVTLSGLL